MLYIAAGLVACLAIWAVIDGLRLRADLDGGQERLTSIGQREIEQRNGVAAAADAAADRLERADRIARRSPPLRLAALVPIVGRQVAGLRTLTGAAATLGRTGRDAAAVMQARLDEADESSEARVALLATAVEELGGVRRVVAGIELGDGGGLLPPVSGAHRQLQRRLAEGVDRLDEGVRFAGGLERMFRGPTLVTLLAGNNAEMRAGAMPLTVGALYIQNGSFSLVGPWQASHLHLNEGPVPTPQNLRDLYGWMGIGQEWRSTSTSPNFPAVAPLFSAMAREKSPRRNEPHGVIFVDVIALRELLEATGPIEVEDRLYNADNVVEQVLYRNYLEYPAREDADERVDVQGEIARAAFAALEGGRVSFGKLAGALSSMARTRHLMAWSVDPELQALWSKLGVDGALPPNGLMINVQNISANKLDYWIRPVASLRTLRVHDGRRYMQLSVRVPNPPRRETSDYIEGGNYARRQDFPVGDHNAYLVVYLPMAATDIRSVDPPFTTLGEDGGLRVVGMKFRVPLGHTIPVVIDFAIPADLTPRLIPSGRAHPMAVFVEGRRFTDERPLLLPLSPARRES